MLSLESKLTECFSPKILGLNIGNFWDWFQTVSNCGDSLVSIPGLMSSGFVVSFGVPVVG